MAYYSECPICGCNLDPGERCDCERERAEERERNKQFYRQVLRTDRRSGQMVFSIEELRGGVKGA